MLSTKFKLQSQSLCIFIKLFHILIFVLIFFYPQFCLGFFFLFKYSFGRTLSTQVHQPLCCNTFLLSLGNYKKIKTLLMALSRCLMQYVTNLLQRIDASSFRCIHRGIIGTLNLKRCFIYPGFPLQAFQYPYIEDE